jgi:hypothetical protein
MGTKEPSSLHPKAMKIEDLSDPEIKEALMRTQLGIVFANFPDKSSPIIQAAHGAEESFIILRHSDDQGWDGWRLSESAKGERKEHYRSFLKKFQDRDGATIATPDGREIKL